MTKTTATTQAKERRAKRPRAAQPPQGAGDAAQPAADQASPKVSFVWTEDPKTPVQLVLAAEGQPNAFRLRSKEDAGLLVDQLRGLGHRESFTLAAWLVLSRQLNALLPLDPRADEVRNFGRVRSQLDKLVNRAAHRRRRLARPAADPAGVQGAGAVKQHAGFKRRLRVSDAFADFAAASGAGWQRGEFHSRSNCGTLVHRHIRLNGLRLKKMKAIRVDELLATIVPASEVQADGTIPAGLLQRILTRHCGHTLPSETTACQGDLPAEDDAPLPEGFTKPQAAPTQSVTHTQLARVSQVFAETVIVGQPLLDGPPWTAGDKHSRKTCAQLLERYGQWKGLRLPNGTDDKERTVVRYGLDEPVRQLFRLVGLDPPAELTRKDIQRLVTRHVTGDPTPLPSLCPPVADYADIERVRVPPLPGAEPTEAAETGAL